MPQSNTKKRSHTLRSSLLRPKRAKISTPNDKMPLSKSYPIKIHVSDVIQNRFFTPVFSKPKSYEKRSYSGYIILRANEIKESKRIEYEEEHGVQQTADNFEYYWYTNGTQFHNELVSVITVEVITKYPDLTV